jgi:aspartate racemase
MRCVGIIGGMGPLATVDLYRKVLAWTDAARDQDNVPLLIDNNTAIPDRTAGILGRGPSALDELLRSAKRLEAAGAEGLCMACNTAHYYYPQIAAAVSVPVLHMPELTAQACAARGLETVALLATDGTVRAGVYAGALATRGIRLLTPDEDGQRAVMSVIYDGVKAGRAAFPIGPLQAVADGLAAAGADAFILGCTELPVAAAQYGLRARVLDPTDLLAREIVRFAGGRLRERS